MTKTTLLPIVTFFAFSFAATIAQEATQVPEQAPRSSSAVAPDNEERLAIETKEKSSPAMRGLRLEREYRPRLPNNFSSIVGNNTAQKEEIYKILTEYNEVIALLELRVALLKNERDVKIDAVLTPTQQQRLNRPVRTLLPRTLLR